jgi:hypothetical protein
MKYKNKYLFLCITLICIIVFGLLFNTIQFENFDSNSTNQNGTYDINTVKQNNFKQKQIIERAVYITPNDDNTITINDGTPLNTWGINDLNNLNYSYILIGGTTHILYVTYVNDYNIYGYFIDMFGNQTQNTYRLRTKINTLVIGTYNIPQVCNINNCNIAMYRQIVKNTPFNNTDDLQPDCNYCDTRWYTTPNNISLDGKQWLKYDNNDDAYDSIKLLTPNYV